MHHTVTVRTDVLRQRVDAAGWTAGHLATRTGMAQSSMSRLLRGQVCPSPKFIAAALITFPDARFDDLFAITQEPESTA